MPTGRTLVIDDEPRIRSIISALLGEQGYDVRTASSGEEGIAAYREFLPAVVVLDMRMPGMDGMAVLRTLNEELRVDCKIIIVTGHGEVRSAVEAIKQGAFDYIQKPFDNDELLAVVGRAAEMVSLKRRVQQLEEQLQETYGFSNIVGVSDKMKSTFALMRKFAAAAGTVVLSGESGTGKELVARAIHQAGKRKTGPFVAVNCGAIPANLIESEFFGHEPGAFTDAKQLRLGKFETADGGTLFLDEIGELASEAQVKLLRVLEEGEFNRVGGSKPIAVDVRVLAATNRDLQAMMADGAFREDLYWRLHVLSLHLSPLRDRREDIPLLVEHFLDKHAPAGGDARPHVSDSAMDVLMAHNWPGNVRELENCIYSALTLLEGSTLEPADLPVRMRAGAAEAAPTATEAAEMPLARIAAEATATAEVHAIRQALQRTAGNREKAAELLGVSRKTLYRKMQQHGID